MKKAMTRMVRTVSTGDHRGVVRTTATTTNPGASGVVTVADSVEVTEVAIVPLKMEAQ